jgi:hypothetical protein
VPLPGLYPMNAETKARYEAARELRLDVDRHGTPMRRIVLHGGARQAGGGE